MLGLCVSLADFGEWDTDGVAQVEVIVPPLGDVPIKELVPELTTKLELPTTGPDGRPMSYRLDSKALGRELKEDETLATAGVPQGDRLMMTADVTAG